MSAGLNPAVAVGGMDCDTVDDAATDAAEDVLCAVATAARTVATRAHREIILMVDVVGRDVVMKGRRCFSRREVVCGEKLCQLMQLVAGCWIVE